MHGTGRGAIRLRCIYAAIHAGACSRIGALILAAIVGWHFLYVPLHLISYEHYGGFFVQGKTDCDPEHETGSGDHKTHAASDHLAGFWTIYATPFLSLFSVFSPHGFFLLTLEKPQLLILQPRDRGPPASFS